MNTIVRSLIVWLLLLALPFQGVAAARMLPSAHAPAAPAASLAAPSAAPSAAPLAKPCHDMPAAHAAKACAGEEQHKHRSACADCCIVVALVPAPLAPPAFAPPSIAIPFRAGHVASVDPTLPERPPRRLAA